MINQSGLETPRVAAPGEPHLACILLLDTSGSMSGDPINSLNRAINDFKQKTSMDELAQKRVDIAIIQFDDHASVVQDFTPISQMEPVNLTVGGCTAMGEAINLAIDKVKERKRFYASMGTPFFKPWIFMITDGAPTDDITSAIQRIKLEESKGGHGTLKFFALGVPGYDKETLFSLTNRVLELSDTDFSGIFNCMSESMVSVNGVGVDASLPQNARIVPPDWNS